MALIKKICTKCNTSLDLDEFYKSKSSKDGHMSECKECYKKRVNEYNHKHKEHKNEVNLRHYHRNKDKWKNIYSKREYHSQENITRNLRSWQSKNRDRLKQYANNRQCKAHNISDEEWIICKQFFNDSCAYCGLSYREHEKLYNQDLHKEHVDPNGSNEIDNCVPSCKSCNSSKSILKLDEWYNESNHVYSKERLEIIFAWLNIFN